MIRLIISLFVGISWEEITIKVPSKIYLILMSLTHMVSTTLCSFIGVILAVCFHSSILRLSKCTTHIREKKKDEGSL